MDAFYKMYLSFLLNDCISNSFKLLKRHNYYHTETLISLLFPLIDFSCPYLFLSVNLSFE